MSGIPNDVIDWTEAMQQTGDDEEFLRELLADLRQETDTQVANIEQIIQVCGCNGGYLQCGVCVGDLELLWIFPLIGCFLSPTPLMPLSLLRCTALH